MKDPAKLRAKAARIAERKRLKNGRAFLDEFDRRADQWRLEADHNKPKYEASEAVAVLRKVEDGATRALARADKVFMDADGPMDEAEFQTFQRSIKTHVDLKHAADVLRPEASKKARRAARITVRENEPYVDKFGGPDFIRDHCIASQPVNLTDVRQREARDRLAKHATFVSKWTGADARLRDASLTSRNGRSEPVTAMGEHRDAMSTAPGFGGELVPPAWALDQFVTWLPSLHSLSTDSTPMSLGEYGLDVVIPYSTSSAGIGVQVDNTGVTAAEFQTGLFSVDGSLPLYTHRVELQAGTAFLSAQLAERGGGPNVSVTDIVMKQLNVNLHAQVNIQCLNAATAFLAGAATSDSSTWSVEQFWLDLATARGQVQDASGESLRPTNLYVPGYQADKIMGASDGDYRPIFTPDTSIANNPDTADIGLNLQGLRVKIDSDVPNDSSGNNQLLVGSSSTLLLYTSAPYLTVYCEGDTAPYLGYRVTLRQYCLAVATRPWALVNGSTYAV
jgi:hypothetical protein